MDTIKQVYSFSHLFLLSGYKGRYVSSDNCKVRRQSRSEYNLPPSERILSENLAFVSDTPERVSGNGNKRLKENRKTDYTEHTDRMLPGKLFFFLRMAEPY